MKLQLKRSNVLDGSVAKPPTAPQMEYGELAVNYNADDPVIFIKDSDGLIIRLTNRSPKWSDIIGKPDVNDGAINISGGEGITATGDNASANQSADTTRTLSVDATWLNSWIGANITPANNGKIDIEAGDGIITTGSNATANQPNDTVRTISVDSTWLNTQVGNGEINIAPGAGLTASGDNASANQSVNTTRTLTVVGDPGYAIDVTATGIRFGNNWSNIPVLPGA